MDLIAENQQTLCTEAEEIIRLREELSRTQEANFLLRKTISCLNEAVFIVNTNSRRIEDVNICAVDMFGFAREELIGAQTSILHLNDEMYQRFGAEMLRSYQATGHYQTNYKMKRKDGTVFPSEHYVSPIIDEYGNYKCHVCVVRDVSARTRAEEELAQAVCSLAERKSFFESVISNLQHGIIVTDLEMRITMVNSYVQNLCGKSAEEIVGMALHELCPELAAQLSDKVPANEIAAHFPNVELTVGYNHVDFKNANGETVGHIINFRDLTEIVRIRGQILQKNRLSAMGEVIAGVAHEMRNPLFGMTTVGKILSLELDLSPAHRALMDSFMKEAQRLNNLVQDLLDGTRELKLVKKIINISLVIDASLQICQKHLQEKQIALTWNHPDSTLLIEADPDKLEQVFLNLIQNAIDASNSGAGIEIVVETAATSFSVIIIDSGHGIPDKILPDIFNIFFTSKKGGTGMGLYLSKNIAEAHGGTLTAENMPGKGAKFILNLPRTGDNS